MSAKLKNTFLYISFILLILTLFMTAYIYEHKYTQQSSDLENELATLQEKLSKLQEEHTSTISSYELDYKKHQERVKELEKQIEKLQKENKELLSYNGKTVYLTFDDGPSENTIKILDTLKKKNVKATFFPIGNSSDWAKGVYQRMVDEGHGIGNHTYSHNYASIYQSVHHFKNDFNRLQDLFEETVDHRPSIYRFPGGSNNNVHKKFGQNGLPKDIAKSLAKDGFVYVDWNVDSTDASTIKQSKSKIITAVLNGVRSHEESIVLFHDSAAKTTTAEALPHIIDTLKKEGYRFRVLEEDGFNVQFLNR